MRVVQLNGQNLINHNLQCTMEKINTNERMSDSEKMRKRKEAWTEYSKGMAEIAKKDRDEARRKCNEMRTKLLKESIKNEREKLRESERRNDNLDTNIQGQSSQITQMEDKLKEKKKEYGKLDNNYRKRKILLEIFFR